MSQAAAAFDLSCFAYLSMPDKTGGQAGLISNYPLAWTTHYLQRHYERFDPVIVQALGQPEPFEWGLGIGSLAPSKWVVRLSGTGKCRKGHYFLSKVPFGIRLT